MQIFQSKLFRWGLFILVLTTAIIQSFKYSTKEEHSPNGYDEQMWISSSIASYNMFFKGYQRETKALDNWFATYAWRNKVPIFTGEKWEMFKPDTVKFPYDFVTVKQRNQSYSIVVKYDLNKFPRKHHQWFDKDMWTFGWKAPNMGKYIMGWAVHTFGSEKPNPNGYYSYYIPEQYVDSLNSKRNVPSGVLGNTTFSYAPEEFVMIGRRVNMIFMAMTIAITFIIGWFFLNYWVGFSAAAWLALNRTFIETNSMTGLDSFAVCFSMAAVLGLLVSLKLLKAEEKWWKVILSSVLTGLMIAFAVSSKLNAGMLVYVAFAIYVLAAILLFFHSRKKDHAKSKEKSVSKSDFKNSLLLKGLVSGALVGSLSVGVFIFLNPQVQGDPKGKIKTMQQSIDDYFSRRALNFTQNQIVDRMKAINAEIVKLAQEQKMDMNAANNMAARLNQINQQLSAGLANQTEEKQGQFLMKKANKLIESLNKLESELWVYNPEFKAAENKFNNWVLIKNDWPSACALALKRIAVVEEEGTKAKYYGTFGWFLKFPYSSLDGILAVAGLIFILLLAYKETLKELFVIPSLAILTAFALIFYGNVDFMWIDWQRYLTPVFPVYSLMIGMGIVYGVKFINERIQKSKKAKT